ncbi:MAG: hypothetical protein J5680_03815 [Neisseriaceae bacterium]|nr:hypothetical protein [Neisseriaceae bacterium]
MPLNISGCLKTYKNAWATSCPPYAPLPLYRVLPLRWVRNPPYNDTLRCRRWVEDPPYKWHCCLAWAMSFSN